MKKVVMLLCMLGLAVPMFALNSSKDVVQVGKYRCEIQWTEGQYWQHDWYACGENVQLAIHYYPLGVFSEEEMANVLTPKEYLEEKVEYFKESFDEVKEEDLENDRKIVYAHNDATRRILLLDGEKILDFGVYHEQYDPANEEEDGKAIQQAKVPAEAVDGF